MPFIKAGIMESPETSRSIYTLHKEPRRRVPIHATYIPWLPSGNEGLWSCKFMATGTLLPNKRFIDVVWKYSAVVLYLNAQVSLAVCL